MERRDEIKPLKIRDGGVKKINMSVKPAEEGGGRRTVIMLFLLTIILSLILWLQSNISSWWSNVVGPSKWSFSK